MTGRDIALAERILHGLGKLNQAHQVGDRGAVLAEPTRQHLLRITVSLDELPVAPGFFDGREVFALDVLQQRDFQ